MLQHLSRFIFATLMLTSTTSFAAADFYQGIRQMGMGGAAIAVVNDETALLLNPNGLGRLREPYLTIIDPEVTTNTQSVKTVQDLAIINGADIPEVYNELAGKQGDRYFYRSQIFPSFATRNFGIGFLAKNEVQAERLVANDFLRLKYTSDLAAVAGYNWSAYGGILKLGASVKAIDRVAHDGDVDPAVQGLDIKNYGRGGLGLGADVAMSVSSPTTVLPTLSVIAKDVGDTSFTLGDSTRDYPDDLAPAKIPMSVDIAVAIFPIHSNDMRSTFTIEYDDVTNKGDAERKLHAGYEINLGDSLFLRAGYNRGYLTGGFEWATRFFQFQMAYYNEEIGTDELPIRDERLAAKFLLRF